MMCKPSEKKQFFGVVRTRNAISKTILKRPEFDIAVLQAGVPSRGEWGPRRRTYPHIRWEDGA